MSAEGTASRSGRWLATALVLVAAASVVAAVLVMGSPASQREAKLDRRRIADLQRIGSAIEQHARVQRALPSDLAALNASLGATLRLHDPDTGTPYRYEPTGPSTYRLCARFTGSSAERGEHPMNLRWHHPHGEHCFERRIELPAE